MKRREKVAPLMVALMVIASFTQLLADDYDPIQKDGDSITFNNILIRTLTINNLYDNASLYPEIIFATSDKRLFVLNQTPMRIQFSIETNDIILGILVADVTNDNTNELIFWTEDEIFINNKSENLYREDFNSTIRAVACIDGNADEQKDIVIAFNNQLIVIDSLGHILWHKDLKEITTNIFVSNLDLYGQDELIVCTMNQIEIYSYAGGLLQEIDFSLDKIRKVKIMKSNTNEQIVILTNKSRIYKISNDFRKILIYSSKDQIVDFTFASLRADAPFDEYIIFWSYFGTISAINLGEYSENKEFLWTFDLEKKFAISIETNDLDNKEIPGQFNVNVREIIISTRDGYIYVYAWNPYRDEKSKQIKVYKINESNIVLSKVISREFPKILLQVNSNGKIQKYLPMYKEYFFLNQDYENAVKYFNENDIRHSMHIFENCRNDEEMSKYYGLYEDCKNKLDNIYQRIKDCKTKNIFDLGKGREYLDNNNYELALDTLFEIYKSYYECGLVDSDNLVENYTFGDLREDILFCDLILLDLGDKRIDTISTELDLLMQIYPSLSFIGSTDFRLIIQRNEKFYQFKELSGKYGDIRYRIDEILQEMSKEADESFKRKDYDYSRIKYTTILNAEFIVHGKDSENYKRYQMKLDEINKKISERNVYYIIIALLIILGISLVFVLRYKGHEFILKMKKLKGTKERAIIREDPNIDEILQYIKIGEGQEVEFKEKWSSYLNIAKKMVAFANSNDGIIIFGVKKDKTIVGIEQSDIDDYKKKIIDCGRDHVKPSITPKSIVYDLPDGKIIIGVVVKEDLREINMDSNNDRWIRKGEHCYKPNPDESKELQSKYPNQ